MKGTLTHKILKEHLVEGSLETGNEIAVRIDRTLTQDATGTMAYLQFEALEIPSVKTELSVSYVDHNTLQTDFMNADDHLYLQSVAAKYGIYFSRPGNGICHQVNLERFSRPGRTLLGSDSHTPTAGGVGMLAIGAGGLDVAVAMGGAPFYLEVPRVVGVRLTGKRQAWVAAKDVILEVLRTTGVKGGVGKILEYFGDGVEDLDVYERATITNMGAETGATTSIFPSDKATRKFFVLQERLDDWEELIPDDNAQYDEIVEIDLSRIEPLVATPHSPGNVSRIREIEGLKVQQVAIGSCTNSSLKDLMIVAAILRGKKVHPNLSLVISPGSRQVLEEIARNGDLKDLISSGARIIESACGPCIGMGQAPPSGSVSVRTFNRNFEGRSGTRDAELFLVSPETAAATAIFGVLTDPRKLGDHPEIKIPDRIKIDDGMILAPSSSPEEVKIVRGPNIKPLPQKGPLEDDLHFEVLLHVGDNITTDHIMPAGAKILPLRSNVPAISEHVFERIDSSFASRAKEKGGGFIVGGGNYGQGSSREHAALGPMYLGVKAVIAKSFARIHKANLVNFGILPLEFDDERDYDSIDQGNRIEIKGIRKTLKTGQTRIAARNTSKGTELYMRIDLSPRSREILLAGGLLNYIRESFH
ncbi:MAG: aconitate hydratase [Candidatus Hodarchaeota archaeon]